MKTKIYPTFSKKKKRKKKLLSTLFLKSKVPYKKKKIKKDKSLHSSQSKK